MFCTMSTSLVSSLVPYLDTSSPSTLTTLLISSTSTSPSPSPSRVSSLSKTLSSSSSLVSSLLPLPPLLPPTSTPKPTTATAIATAITSSTSTLSTIESKLPPASNVPPCLLLPPLTPFPSHRPSKVQFKDQVEVQYTFPSDVYDRQPIQPMPFTTTDYLEFQTLLNEMHVAMEKEIQTRQLKQWARTHSSTFSSFSSFSSPSPSSSTTTTTATATTTMQATSKKGTPFMNVDLQEIISPTSFHSPMSMELCVQDLMEWSFNETELKLSYMNK